MNNYKHASNKKRNRKKSYKQKQMEILELKTTTSEINNETIDSTEEWRQ